MTTDEIAGKPRVPVGELKALARGLRARIDQKDRGDDYQAGMSAAVRELEALIERYDYDV